MRELVIRSLFFLLALVCLLSLAACGALRQVAPTLPHTATPALVRVTAEEIAQAMESDSFYARYGHDTLLVQGSVSDVNRQNNDLVVELSTTVATRVQCDLGNSPVTVHAGDSITVKANAADAQRGQLAVILRNCTIP